MSHTSHSFPMLPRRRREFPPISPCSQLVSGVIAGRFSFMPILMQSLIVQRKLSRSSSIFCVSWYLCLTAFVTCILVKYLGFTFKTHTLAGYQTQFEQACRLGDGKRRK